MRGIQPRWQAHRHRVLGQDGADLGCRDRQPIGELLKGHNEPVISAAFSPDGKAHRHAILGQDGADLGHRDGPPSGEPLKGHEGLVNSAAFSPDGKRIVTASADGTARIWDVSRHPGAGFGGQSRRPPLPHAYAAQSLLPAARAAGMVHRDGEVALQHARMETVARRLSRRQEPAAARSAVGGFTGRGNRHAGDRRPRQ